MKISSLVAFGLAIALACGCATEDSVDDPAGTHFIKFYGRDGDQTGRDLVVLPDGTMVLFGTSRPTVDNLGSQWYVTRVDAKGAILWEQEFGGQQNEEARDIELTSTGNLVLVGNTYRAVDDRDVMIILVDAATGQKIDSATHFVHDGSLGNPLGDEDASTVTETADGFVVAGSTTYVLSGLSTDLHDALQLRVLTDLKTLRPAWSQSFGYPSDDYSVKIAVAPALGYGSFHVFGSTNKAHDNHINDYDFWLIVLGPNGGSLGNDTFSGDLGDERASSFCLTPAGYFMTGIVQSGTAPQDIYIADASFPSPSICSSPPPPAPPFPLVCTPVYVVGVHKPLSINLGSALRGATAVTTSPISGGYLILSEENGFNANQNWMLTRVNNNGTLAWVQPIVFGGEGLDEIGAVKELPDGRIVIIGTMRTGRPDVGEFKMTLIKVNKDGKFEK